MSMLISAGVGFVVGHLVWRAVDWVVSNTRKDLRHFERSYKKKAPN